MFAPALAYWVHDLSPFLIQFNEKLGIRYYGLAYLAGFGGAMWLLRLYYQKGRTTLTPNASVDLVLALVIGVIVGGRLGEFLLYHPKTLFSDPLAFFRVWEGGMASHGGFLGVAVALWWFARSRKIPFLHLADIVASVTSIGLFFGRVANFINGELYGKPSAVPWAVIFENTGGGPEPRHPSQLYEAALEGLLLLAYMQWRVWGSEVTKRQPGRIAGEYWIGYALVRAIGELFRTPDAIILGLSSGTFYSIFLFAGGVALIVAAKKNAPVVAGAR
ncbi:prolipoprotein diacylglyceryl transferase [Oleiharenicola lentus]|uniref:prolipoprotein diacylglyceryl transferase n=1 Tax=Oleiharenicola lentus TaxID=2508720 RepID=UPI003F681862